MALRLGWTSRAVSHCGKLISAMSRPLLIAFDFDHTIVDDNTDIVVRKLLKEDKVPETIRRLYRSDGWTAYMEKIFELLHANSITELEINEAIENITAVSFMEDLLRELYVKNCEIIIISDSNSVFIERWLQHKNLDCFVTRVFTNPAKYNDNGLLKIDMYHVQDSCELSTKNLCKGQILDTYIQESLKKGVSFERIAYVGDGKNDLCPILRLSENDVAFPRSNYPLAKLIEDARASGERKISARIVPWSCGKTILQELFLDNGLCLRMNL